MRYSNKIENVNKYYLLRDGLYCFSLDSNLTKFNENQKSWEVTSLPTQHFLLGRSEEYLISYWQFKVLISLKNGVIANENKIAFKPLTLNCDIKGVFVKDEKFYYGSISTEFENEIFLVCTNKSISVKALERFIICQEGWLLLSCYSLSTKEEIWKIEMEADMLNEIFVYDNLVIVCAKDDIMRAFDIETGTLVWQCEEVYAYNLFLNGDFIYCLVGHFYERIDVRTGKKLISQKIIERMEGHLSFQIGTENCFDGENIYFSGQDSSKVGAFNTNTLKIEWLYELPKPEKYKVSYFLERPQYHNGKVYVLDSEHTLHIFEK